MITNSIWPLWVLDSSKYSWSEDARENLILHFLRTDNFPLELNPMYDETADPIMRNIIEDSLKDGTFVLIDTLSGLMYALSEKGLEEAQGLLLIYNL